MMGMRTVVALGVLALSAPAGAERAVLEGRSVATGVPATGPSRAALGASPDGSQQRVTAVALADGSVVQVQDGRVAPLAPMGTVAPLPSPGGARAGMVFAYLPARVLYVCDPLRDAIVVLHLSDDAVRFHVDAIGRYVGGVLRQPVDMAPVQPDIRNPGFAAGTTLTGATDFYVANRGDGTVARLTQAGAVVEVHRVNVGGAVLGSGRLTGITVSDDATRIWLRLSDSDDAVVEVPAFGPGGSGLVNPTE